MVFMQRKSVLLVENEESLLELISTYLIKEGYLVHRAKDGFLALSLFKNQDIDLVILDIMLDQSDGWTVCREIRKESNIPILMLTARNQESDKLFGFELGADDYMTKPFSLKELVARSNALIRRSDYQIQTDMIQKGGLAINQKSHKVYVEDKEIELTPKEYDLLLYFIKRENEAISREDLLSHVWGIQYFGDLRTVDTHIKRLRQKIEPLIYIHTIFGVGYRFEVKS
jgi:two-component system response regulator ResD